MVFTGSTALKVWLLLLLFPMGLCVFVVPVTLAWHDWQRVIQILLSLAAIAFLGLAPPGRQTAVLLDRHALLLCFLVLLLGALSSWHSQQPQWAFTEMATVAACGCIALAFANIRRLCGERCDALLVFFVVFLCAIKISQYGGATLSAFYAGGTVLDTDLLLNGFSNKRFYGQFQTFTLPLLALPLLLVHSSRTRHLGVFILLSSWWMIAMSGGTRGTWLGMLAVFVLMGWLGSMARRWLYWQLAAALLGGVLFWLLFSVLPGYLGIEIANFAGNRLNSSLSLREVIWKTAWEMTCDSPWLGVGPMHFANVANGIAAHPHQAVLQWASEWGVPSTLCVIALALRGLFATLRLVRERIDSTAPVDQLRLCLFASLIGALAQSMVDGVIVMPYSQLWLALVVGWLIALHVWRTEPGRPGAMLRWSWRLVSVAAVALLIWVAMRDLPHLQERNDIYVRDYGGYFLPRFWAQGVIAQTPH